MRRSPAPDAEVTPALGRLVRAVGWTSIGLAAVATAQPREVASVAGVRDTDGALLPVLVRLNAARQAVLGIAILTRRPTPVQRSSDLFLPLTALDALAVAGGVRSGVLRPRSAAMALAVLGTNAWVSGRARR